MQQRQQAANKANRMPTHVTCSSPFSFFLSAPQFFLAPKLTGVTVFRIQVLRGLVVRG
jgi:hypothetical protein